MDFCFQPAREHSGPFVYAKGEAPAEKLLPELWWEVVTYLTKKEWLTLRLISKEVERKIFPLVYKLMLPHLPRLNTNLSRKNIQYVHTIASNPDLCQVPRTMQVAYPWRYSCFLKYFNADSHFEELCSELPEIHTLINDLKYSLTNCRSFEICLDVSLVQLQAESEYINILLKMIAEADINPEKLTFVLPAEGTCRSRWGTDPFLPPIIEPHNMIRSWTNLHTLTIVDVYGGACYASVESAVCQILKKAPCLERLIYQAFGRSRQDGNVLLPLSKAGPFPRLKHLELHSAAVHSENVLRLLRVKGQYLVSVGFFNCWSNGLERWEALLRLMKDHMPRLNSFTLDKGMVGFPRGDFPIRPYNYTYEGPNIGDILGKLRFGEREVYIE
ncbi:hypothetical protein AtubIFM56815_004614 [Aspergillus tubingensis]|uniref:Uncharacterized protein n=1 Tax=Aspergillus tubingensis TaxID=5068 RepID=A0A8H3SWP8_ASPTU|nr:cytochrome c oxidase subunit VIa family protein [Aspergillus tubingensis]GFN17381.1 cytochrome c oxidase subunit VIa family protein [Aspergillus tubingensis]GLA80982.1 hypothetical protein AtubIFM56815_004614 [Aspergillus tubingensis]GLB17912.1 hypothetical protein AtubIFM61612_007802 [Aspergillus tubingensis]